jgi:pimeloyl-ACP methyl ester carboxylesterase
LLDRLDSDKVTFVEVGGVTTRCYEDGDGEPLVLVHGGQFGDLYALDHWSLNVGLLSTAFNVHAFDRLGQGFTDNPSIDADFTFDAVVRHAVAFVDARSRPAHLVGHSRGALVVAAIALTRPDLVRTITLVDSSTIAPQGSGSRSGVFYAEINAHAAERRPAEAAIMEVEAQSITKAHISSAFAHRRLEILMLAKTSEARRRMTRLREAVWAPSLERARVDALDAIAGDGFPVPTMIVWGLNDRSAPLDLGLDLLRWASARTPDLQFLAINGAGHYVFRERAERFNRALTSFAGAGT